MAKALRVEIIGDAAAYSRSLKLASAETATFASRTKSGFAGVAKSGLVLGAAFTAVSVVAVKMRDEFEASMSKIKGLVGASQEQVDEWGHDILQLAPQVGKAPKELADALFFITSAGLKGAKAMDALKISAQASAAGLGETKVVADAVTSAMNSYKTSNLTAAESADVLVATVREGKTEASALAPVIGNLLPLAAQMGVHFNEIGAAIASQTRVGIDAATSVTNLSATFSTLLRNAPKTVAGLKKVGLTTGGLKQEIKEKGLLAALLTLKQAFHGNTDAMAAAFPNVRALRGVLALVGTNAKTTSEIFSRMADNTGSLGKAFQAASETGEFKFKQLGAGLQAFMITFGAAIEPVVNALLAKLIPAMMQLSDWTSAHKEQIKAVFDEIGKGIELAFQGIEIAVKAVIPVVQAIVAWFQTNWPKIAQITMQVFNTVKTVVMTAVNVILALWARFGPVILSQVKAVWDFVKNYIQGALNVIRGIINVVMGLIHGDWSQVWKGIQQVFSGVWQAMTAILRFAWNSIKNVLTAGLRVVQTYWQVAWAAMKAVVSNTWNSIVRLLTTAVSTAAAKAKAIGDAIVRGIKSGLTAVYAAVKGGLDAIWRAITTVAHLAYGAAIAIGKEVIHGIVDGLIGLASAVGGAIKKGFWAGVHAAGSALKGSGEFQITRHVIGEPMAQGVVEGFASAMATRASEFAAPLRKIALKLAAEIPGMRTTLASAFRSMAQDILSAFDDVASNWTPPSQKILEKMQLEDTINQATQQVADAQTAIDNAQAKLNADLAAGPQEGETQVDFQARIDADKAELQNAITQLGAAQRSYEELQLQLRAQQEQAAHDKQMESDKNHLAAQLLQIQTWLAKHPGEYAKAQDKVLALMKKYHIPMYKAGNKLSGAFADGLKDGIDEVVKAARKLADALEQIPGVSPPGGGRSPGTTRGHGGASSTTGGTAGGRGGGTSVVVNVHGTVVTPGELVDAVHDGLLKKQQRTGGLGFA